MDRYCERGLQYDQDFQNDGLIARQGKSEALVLCERERAAVPRLGEQSRGSSFLAYSKGFSFDVDGL